MERPEMRSKLWYELMAIGFGVVGSVGVLAEIVHYGYRSYLPHLVSEHIGTFGIPAMIVFTAGLIAMASEWWTREFWGQENNYAQLGLGIGVVGGLASVIGWEGVYQAGAPLVEKSLDILAGLTAVVTGWGLVKSVGGILASKKIV